MNSFFINDGTKADFHTVSQLDRAIEQESAKYNGWQILPECVRKRCGRVAEFVRVTGPLAFERERLCYGHGKDEANTIRCLCEPQDTRNYI